MGNGALHHAPDFENFRKFSEEYDKLRNAGLSTEEMHGILCHRLKAMSKQGQSAPSGPAQPAVVIEDHGGGKENSVRQVENTQGRGESKSLPPAQNQNVSTKPLLTRQQSQATQAQDQKIGLVLLIDDSTVAAKVASKVLIQQRFDVVIANSAKTGFEILLSRKDDVDLVFLDVVMPGVDGVECLGWIKDHADVAHIPVYMLSGLEDQMLTDVCLERGAEGMLLKPLNPGMVRTIMETHRIGIASSDGPALVVSKPLIAQSLSVVIPKNDFDPGSTSTSVKSEHKIDNAKALLNKKMNTVAIGAQAPAFKLIDSDFREFVFPNPSSRKNILLLFIPTIFCTHIFEETGFLMRFFSHYDQLIRNNTLFVACISADLPFALAAAKKRFQLPFAMFSDPTLFVAQRYVGSVDVGQLMTRLDIASNANNKNDLLSCDHRQNSFVGPAIGMVLLNRRRDVLQKWVAQPGLFDSRMNLQEGQFPDNFDEWLAIASQIATASPRRTPTSSKDAQSPTHSLEHTKDKERDREDVRYSKVSRPETRGSTIAADPEQTQTNSTALSTSPVEQKINKHSSSSGRPNILVVDDSSVSARVCSKKLEIMGFNVSTAYNGQQAFDLLRKKPPDYFSVILSDVVMPVCDGIGLLKLIKAEDAFKDIPILMMSGLEGEELSKSCLELGANALLKKPFDDAKFLEVIRDFNINKQ